MMHNKCKVIFEKTEAGLLVCKFSIKDNFISMIPYVPASDYENLLEGNSFVSCSTLSKHVQKLDITIPFNNNFPP